jgi:hypothetical protein
MFHCELFHWIIIFKLLKYNKKYSNSNRYIKVKGIPLTLTRILFIS